LATIQADKRSIDTVLQSSLEPSNGLISLCCNRIVSAIFVLDSMSLTVRLAVVLHFKIELSIDKKASFSASAICLSHLFAVGSERLATPKLICSKCQHPPNFKSNYDLQL
jgi:hypothetical protein